MFQSQFKTGIQLQSIEGLFQTIAMEMIKDLE